MKKGYSLEDATAPTKNSWRRQKARGTSALWVQPHRIL